MNAKLKTVMNKSTTSGLTKVQYCAILKKYVRLTYVMESLAKRGLAEQQARGTISRQTKRDIKACVAKMDLLLSC